MRIVVISTVPPFVILSFARNGATKKLVNEANEAKRYVGMCHILCGIFGLSIHCSVFKTVLHSRADRD